MSTVCRSTATLRRTSAPRCTSCMAIRVSALPSSNSASGHSSSTSKTLNRSDGQLLRSDCTTPPNCSVDHPQTHSPNIEQNVQLPHPLPVVSLQGHAPVGRSGRPCRRKALRVPWCVRMNTRAEDSRGGLRECKTEYQSPPRTRYGHYIVPPRYINSIEINTLATLPNYSPQTARIITTSKIPC